MGESRQNEISRRELLKRSVLAGAALTLGPTVLAACGSSSSSASPLASILNSIGASSSLTPKAGGVLKFGMVGDVVTFDPYSTATLNYPILRNFNQFLIDYTEDLQPVPSAATAWEIAADHLSVTVHLDPNITFQTGKAFTADDLVFGLHRGLDPNEGGNLTDAMDFVGDFSTTDDHTVVIHFTKPVADMLVTDLFESFPIVDQTKNSSANLATGPASAGSFSLASYSPNAAINLAKYDKYARAPLPYLDSVTLEVFDSQDTIVSGLQSGSIDGALYVTGNSAKTLASDFDIIEGYPGTDINLLRLNPSQPPFDNQFLRQAIQRAINRDRIVKDVFQGYSAPAYLPFGPHSPAYDAAYEKSLSYDLTAAKQLWQQAGSPTSGSAIVNGSDQQALLILQIIQSDLKQVGFDLSIENQDAQTWYQNLIHGNFGATIGDVGDASKSPSRITTNSLFRTTENPLWKDKLPQAYIDAIAACETALTPADVKTANASLAKVVADGAWGIGINILLSLFVVRKGVFGLARDIDDHAQLEGTWIG